MLDQKSIQKKLLEKRINQLDQLSKGLLNEITKIDDKIRSIRTNDFYNISG